MMKHSMSISIIVLLFFLTNIDFSTENDLSGHHFNYVVFDVMVFVSIR